MFEYKIDCLADFKGCFCCVNRFLESFELNGNLLFDLKLIVKELLTNELKYSKGESRIKINVGSDKISLKIYSQNPFKPVVVKLADENSEGGRGLYLVEKLSNSYFVDEENKNLTVVIHRSVK